MNYLSNEELEQLNLYFNATLYLSVGQLYLLDNPLLKRELKLSDVKPRLVGHWGTVPGQNFLLMHLNRIITKYDLNMIYLIGPGHGGQSAVTNAYLDGTYTEKYPEITQDESGMKKLFKQFSFPKGISSHVAPETPGSIHEGGELGYSLVHAFGAVLDNPDLIATAIVGDGEAETGPLATSWNINKFINPITDGVVLPIIHLNGYKISNPTVLSRLSNDEILDLYTGLGWLPYIIEGDSIEELQNKTACILDKVVEEIKIIKEKAISNENVEAVKWPMIIFRSLKGWTGPKAVEGSFKAHQIPLQISEDEDLVFLNEWLNSYKPEQLFDKTGKVKDEITTFLPKGIKRMSNNPITNGGLLLKELILPNIKDYMIDSKHGKTIGQDMMELGKYLRDVFKLNEGNRNFRMFGPDEAMSNRLNHVFEYTSRQWLMPILENDEYVSPYGRMLDSYLSEHICEGALEGYILTGRHGIFHSYESFVRVVDSMVGIHAKWLKMSNEVVWKKPISSLNIICTSHVWQQDHNGYTHQEPGFINHLLTKKHDIVNIYLPYDANSLIYVVDKSLKSKNQINAIIASKHERPQWLNYEETLEHCKKGIGEFKFANDSNPDIVLACAGDTPTMETLAAYQLLKENTDLNVKVVNVVDLLKLESISDKEFDKLFTKEKTVIFTFHGYKSAIESLIYNRNRRFEIYGYNEEGSITTPFDMRVLNNIDRYHICLNAIKSYDLKYDEFRRFLEEKLMEHNATVGTTGEDIKDIKKWVPKF